MFDCQRNVLNDPDRECFQLTLPNVNLIAPSASLGWYMAPGFWSLIMATMF